MAHPLGGNTLGEDPPYSQEELQGMSLKALAPIFHSAGVAATGRKKEDLIQGYLRYMASFESFFYSISLKCSFLNRKVTSSMRVLSLKKLLSC